MLRFYFEDDSYKAKLEKLFNFFNNTSPFGYVLPEMMSALVIKDAGLSMFIVVGKFTFLKFLFLSIFTSLSYYIWERDR